MAAKPNPRRAIAIRLQSIAQMLAGNADNLGIAPADLSCDNVSLICLELEQAGILARELQDRDSAVAVEECRAELRTHVLLPAGVINLPGLVGVAARCSPKLLGAYARIVTAGPKQKAPPGKPGRKPDPRIWQRNERIRELAKEHGITNAWARLAELSNNDPTIQAFRLPPVSRHVTKNVINPPKKRGSN